ncbi:hypothetical protein J4Q44_G00356670 [Coregonus suidteri]|uniref:Uncharacterized protein n=1 Tax=Coregonus suidteri TaxID=861788 RepID=A0AAN8KQY1_9TELE
MEALEEEWDFLSKTVNQLNGQGRQTLSLGPSPSSSVWDNVDKKCKSDNSSYFSSSDSSSSTDSENEKRRRRRRRKTRREKKGNGYMQSQNPGRHIKKVQGGPGDLQKEGNHVRCFPQRGCGSQHCVDECPSGRDHASGSGVPSFTASI